MLQQAQRLLPHVRANGRPEVTCRDLDDVPLLIVHVFETMTGERVRETSKPFTCPHERADTVQRILNTLEEVGIVLFQKIITVSIIVKAICKIPKSYARCYTLLQRNLTNEQYILAFVRL